MSIACVRGMAEQTGTGHAAPLEESPCLAYISSQANPASHIPSMSAWSIFMLRIEETFEVIDNQSIHRPPRWSKVSEWPESAEAFDPHGPGASQTTRAQTRPTPWASIRKNMITQ